MKFIVRAYSEGEHKQEAHAIVSIPQETVARLHKQRELLDQLRGEHEGSLYELSYDLELQSWGMELNFYSEVPLNLFDQDQAACYSDTGYALLPEDADDTAEDYHIIRARFPCLSVREGGFMFTYYEKYTCLRYSTDLISYP